MLYSKGLTHYQMTNFGLFQTERVCRRQFQISQKCKKVIQTGRKHCGKRRNCSLRAISPFPTVFSKGVFPRGVKSCHCVGMGQIIIIIIIKRRRSSLTCQCYSPFCLFQLEDRHKLISKQTNKQITITNINPIVCPVIQHCQWLPSHIFPI